MSTSTSQKRHVTLASCTVRQLAVDLLSRKEASQEGGTVLLGAGASVSSGIPVWHKLAQQICEECAIQVEDDKHEEAVISYFNRPEVPYSQRYTFFRKHLAGKVPSIGYQHLAQLAKEGLISTILTTNWDPLAELAIFRFISLDCLKVFVRGEMPDDRIAEILEWRKDQIVIVKLHGDAQTRTFMLGAQETRNFSQALTEKLIERLSRCTFIVGQSAQDVDVLTLLLTAKRQQGSLYHIRFGAIPNEVDDLLQRANAQAIHGSQPSILADGTQVNIGDFDVFFSQLDLAVQQELTKKRRIQLRKAESSILNKEKTGVGYINYSRITDLVQHFTLEVRRVEPDLILFIDDPSAPGGMELKRRMMPILRRDDVTIPTASIRVEGSRGSRTHQRAVNHEDVVKLPMKKVKKVLILDAITFSGNTLNLTRDAVLKSYPNVSVILGVLVISQQLYQRMTDADEIFLSQQVTDRYEIFFPWGVTQTTLTFDRNFEGATVEGGRSVAISKRPWGTIEVLASEETTSVRLLTIEAGRKLSFQRHLCRDELFVALDDNIGLDICAEDLSRDANQYDEAVKSLILEKGDYVLIPRGVWHRTKASMDRVRLLEIGFGLYDQDNDIERRWDDFEREHKDGRE